VKTVIEAVVALTTSEAGTEAVNSVALTKLVVLELPFQFTTEPAANPVPVTVRENALDPGLTLVGESGNWMNGTAFIPEPPLSVAGEHRHATARVTNIDRLAIPVRWNLFGMKHSLDVTFTISTYPSIKLRDFRLY
jgi:hypothetical protein